MAIAKTNGFRLLPSYYEAIRDLPDAERLLLYDAVFDFGFGNEVQELPPLLKSLFGLIVPTLERSIRFEEKQRRNGAKGGRPPKTQTKAKETQPTFGENLAVADADADADAVADADADADAVADAVAVAVGKAKPPRASRFSPPTVEEVAEYCLERANGINAQRFVDFYTAKGWKIGKEKMHDWKAAVRTWERSEHIDEEGARDIRDQSRYENREGSL